MIRGVQSLAEQTARQRRGGLTTLARLGGEAMTAPARAGFRKRFEREALELARTQGRLLSQKQLDEATDALLRAHMAMMTERRMQKRYELEFTGDRQEAGRLRQHAHAHAGAPQSVEELMAEAERKALGDDARDRAAIQQMAEPVVLCIGCWLEMFADQAFPSLASSTLCQRHLESYRVTVIGATLGSVSSRVSECDTQTVAAKGVAPPQQKTPRQTRRAPVRQHERSRDLNHRSLRQSL